MSEFWTKIREFAGPGIAIIIGVAFAATVFVSATSVSTSLEKHVVGDSTKYDLVISHAKDPSESGWGEADSGRGEPAQISTSWVESARKTPGVDTINPQMSVFGRLQGNNVNAMASFELLPGSRTALPFVEGRQPARSGEVAISEGFQKKHRISVNDKFVAYVENQLTADELRAGKKPTETKTELTIVGVHGKYFGGSGNYDDTLLSTQLPAGANPDFGGLATISIKPGANPADVTKSLNETLPKQYKAMTPSAWVQRQGEQGQQELRNLLRGVFGAFAVIALGVMSIIVAGTFGIILARRARTAALQRCIGATKSQLVNNSLTEALTVAIFYTAVGVAVGAGIAVLLVEWTSDHFASIPKLAASVQPGDLLWPLTIGVIVTTVAAWLPANKAARVSPLAALHPTAPVTESVKKASAVTIGGAVLAVVGALCMVFGSSSATGTGAKFAWALIGGGMVFVGWNISNSMVLPFLLRLCGRIPAKLSGIPGELAVENVVRNPGRTAMLTAALMVGTTLIVMTSVVAASLVSTIGTALAASSPYDGVVRGTFSDNSVVQKVASVPGVEKVRAEQAINAQISVTSADPEEPSDSEEAGVGNGRLEEIRLVVSDPEVQSVARAKVQTPAVPVNTLLVPEYWMTLLGWKEGATGTVQISGQPQSFTVKKRANGDKFLMNPEDAKKFASSAVLNRVFVRFQDGANHQEVSDNVSTAISSFDDAAISSPVRQRASTKRVTDYVVAGISVLLALSTLIALIGVANTVSLAIAERRKESALIRALGVTRNQLRVMYTLESLLLAVVAITAGTVLGIWFALTGVDVIGSIAVKEVSKDLVVSKVVPWDRLGLIALVSLSAAMLLTAWPAWKSAQIQPATGLTRD